MHSLDWKFNMLIYTNQRILHTSNLRLGPVVYFHQTPLFPSEYMPPTSCSTLSTLKICSGWRGNIWEHVLVPNRDVAEEGGEGSPYSTNIDLSHNLQLLMFFFGGGEIARWLITKTPKSVHWNYILRHLWQDDIGNTSNSWTSFFLADIFKCLSSKL